MQGFTLTTTKLPRASNFEKRMLVVNIIFFDIFLAFTWPLWWVLDIINLIAVALRLKKMEDNMGDLSVSHLWFFTIVSFLSTTLYTWLLWFAKKTCVPFATCAILC